jgi:spore coat polysaccharide biosynthesis protein SpsF
MIGIIIQARLGSTRLPHKMTKPFFGNKGIFELLTEKIQNKYSNLKIVVATTTNPLDDEIVSLCNKMKTDCYRGSENNVLERFKEAANKYNITKIVRVCADNPFLNLNALDELINFSLKSQADYISFKTRKETPTILTHYGFWAEIVKTEALIKVLKLTNDAKYLEHVTNYVYTHPHIFNIELHLIPQKVEENSDIRMTLDTQEDLDLLKEIYGNISNLELSIEDLIEYVNKNETWKTKMKFQILQNNK